MSALEQSQDLFSDAYRNGFSSTVRFLISRGARFEEAEEIAQSAWARGWEARAQVASPASVIPWVNTIAVRTMSKERQRQGRFQTAHADLPSTGMFGRVAARLDALALAAKCASLDRRLLLDRYLGEMPFQDLARTYGLTSVAARIRVHRATQALRQLVRTRQLGERMAV